VTLLEICLSFFFAYLSYTMIERVSKLDEKVDKLAEIVAVLRDRNRDNRVDD